MEKISEKFKKVTAKRLKDFYAVTISIDAPGADSVFIVGDFNNLSISDKSKLERVNGARRKRLSLSKGSHQYRFVVDGKWLEDPKNPHTVVNPYGELNSIIDVK